MDKAENTSLVFSLWAAQQIEMRHWQEKLLPIGNNMVTYDLLLLVYYHTQNNSPLNIKNLFLGLPYSKNCIRNHLEALIKNDWIVEKRNNSDGRQRQLLASKKTLSSFEKYIEYIAPVTGVKHYIKNSEAHHSGGHSRAANTRAQKHINLAPASIKPHS